MRTEEMDHAEPTWSAPDYADSSRFDEYDITLGAGDRAVPGTVTMPHGDGARVGVVLLSGGGPFDRDCTFGPNKPLRDLAWGLASRGVAVLRFDKITYVRPEVTKEPDFTMTDEYVPHAVAAIGLLQRTRNVDPARVFVVGHSMGGKVAPRVAAAEPSVAGLVLLAADAEPMHRASVRVLTYMASVAPSAETDALVATFTRAAAVVDSPDLSRETPSADLPFGMGGAYWLDMRGYDQVAAAAALPQPMLVLQGERDYQVTVADDLARWQAGLESRADTMFRVYPADNHMFFPGTGPSTPADYAPPQHVDPHVITDIADWLAQH
ncbi:S9 family peptidase [Nocardia sp. CS682]|uniref:alpha/beta hydrolase family protein n=1 Tax=Nocardia sp. CS682 TaxID=1047172 RepID=UPI00197DDEDA|nr:alpha/beta fold hydrolase [Nocardia sp. CS682]